MILIFDDDGRFEQAVTLAPKGYREKLTAFGRTWADAAEPLPARPHNLYWDGEAVQVRPTLAPTIDGLALSGLPDPVTVLVDGVPHEIVGGSVTLDLQDPGTYRVEVDHFPFLPWRRDFVV